MNNLNDTIYTNRQLSTKYHTYVRPYHKKDGVKFDFCVPFDILTSQVIHAGCYAHVEYVDMETGEIIEHEMYGGAKKRA